MGVPRVELDLKTQAGVSAYLRWNGIATLFSLNSAAAAELKLNLNTSATKHLENIRKSRLVGLSSLSSPSVHGNLQGDWIQGESV